MKVAQQFQEENTINFNSYVNRRPVLNPKSLSQETYIDYLTNPQKLVVFATGPAGTGKTMLAVLAGITALRERSVKKLVITRPAVSVDDEKHGYLPGDLNSKMEPWVKPIFDVVLEYYNHRELSKMLDEEIIEISPLAFLRGRTFKDSWIIFDEAQNSTVNQMKMVLTRIGEGSKMVITGDLDQNDRKFANDNGLKDFISRLTKHNSKAIASVNFANKDIQRHPVVAEILHLYREADDK
jgi:phosphate starvation-inducible protein PhoH and related proteins